MKGTAPRDAGPGARRGAAGRAGAGREEPGGEPDDRRPAAQRHRRGSPRSARCGCRSFSRSRAMRRCTRWSSRVTGRLLPGTRAVADLRGALSLRLGDRGAEAPGDGDHPRAGALAARGLLRRDRLGGAGRAGGVQRGDPHAGALSRRRGGAERRRRGGGGFDRRRRNTRRRCGKRASPTSPGELTADRDVPLGARRGLRPAAAHLARLARSGGGARGRRSTGRRSTGRWRRWRGDGPLRVRLTLGLDGAAEVAAAPLGAGAGGLDAAAWPTRGSTRDDPWLRVKTSERAALRRRAGGAAGGGGRGVFLNERGEVCEGTITNVFADRRRARDAAAGLRAAAGGAARGAAGAGRVPRGGAAGGGPAAGAALRRQLAAGADPGAAGGRLDSGGAAGCIRARPRPRSPRCTPTAAIPAPS